MAQEPEKPPIIPATVGAVYVYQGRGKMSGKQVLVLGAGHSGNPDLAHVVVLKGKHQERTDTTFGCDPRWLAPPGGKAPFSVYDTALRQYIKGLPQEKQPQPQGIEDPEQFDQGIFWEE